MFKLILLSILIVFSSSTKTKFTHLEDVIFKAKNNSSYLKETKHCHVGNEKIKKQLESLIIGKMTNRQKAEKIFLFVRDKIEDEFYSDTKYGSIVTLDRKKGNCVDKSHLLNALLRTAGIPARYKVGNVRFFKSGYSDHAWCYANIDGKWKDLDASSKMNTFNKIKGWTDCKKYEIFNEIE
jgi:transglutaminase-like putative cysteine protease